MFDHPPKMASVMTPFPYSIDQEMPITEAATMMMEHNIHHLPVKRAGVIESIISDRDIKRAQPIGQHTTENDILVKDLAAKRAYMVDLDDTLSTTLKAMHETGIGTVLVMKEGRLAGIFTEKDVNRILLDWLAHRFPGSPPKSVA